MTPVVFSATLMATELAEKVGAELLIGSLSPPSLLQAAIVIAVRAISASLRWLGDLVMVERFIVWVTRITPSA